MDFQDINRFLTPIGLIIAGIIIKISKKKEVFGYFKNFWLFFIIIGLLLFLFRLYKYLYS
jgi:hypothetical protein